MCSVMLETPNIKYIYILFCNPHQILVFCKPAWSFYSSAKGLIHQYKIRGFHTLFASTYSVSHLEAVSRFLK